MCHGHHHWSLTLQSDPVWSLAKALLSALVRMGRAKTNDKSEPAIDKRKMCLGRLIRRLSISAYLVSDRQLDRNRRSQSFATTHVDCTTMIADDLINNRKSQSGAAGSGGEGLKQIFNLFRRHPPSVICEINLQPPAILAS